MNNTLVSVIIPAYNRAAVLPRAINSILAQTYQDFEIIVVDDCSKDNTDEVMRSLRDPRIRYIKHEKNKGGNAARNTGIKEAKGELIAFLDSDDEWLKDKLTQQIDLFLRSGRSLGLVYGGQKLHNENTGQISDFRGEKKGDVLKDLLVRNYIGSLSVVMVRSEYLRQVNGMDETLKSCQDWDLYIRLSRVCQFDYVNDFLINYYIGRKDPNRISSNRKSIITGHEAVEKKYESEIRQLPVIYRLRHAEYMRDIYAITGELGKVLRISFLDALTLRSPALVLSSPRVIGRCIKRMITKDYGY
jgi:glycosyltransferase involved in cell wall biosynthesis